MGARRCPGNFAWYASDSRDFAPWGVKPRVGTSGRYGWLPVTFLPGMVVYADSTAGTTGPQLLYVAIGAGNLRAYVQGTDDVGHGALSN